ncbi:MAG: GNAT family acetyltransferase [Anaerolineales bacterium]|nr:GNAT family acetyltransferase [Anaerolineales bacterium]
MAPKKISILDRMLPFTIREFHYPADYAAVIVLWQNTGPGIHVGRSDQPEEIAKKLQRDPDLFLLAEIDGRIIGSVLGGFDGRRGIVYHLAVAEEFRQQGIGAALMGELEQRLRTKGCIRSYLLVTKDNRTAQKFYEDLGWEHLDLFTYGKDFA